MVEYNILLAREDLDAVRGDAGASGEQVRAAVRVFAALRAHLSDLARAEAADEARKGLSPDRRWNYPSLERWDRGRTEATYQYWSSMCLTAEARGMSLVDRGEAEELFRQAGEQAALATILYGEYAAQNGKWDRVVHALLHQSAAGFTAYLRSWRASFVEAVEATAALQSSQARRDVRAAGAARGQPFQSVGPASPDAGPWAGRRACR